MLQVIDPSLTPSIGVLAFDRSSVRTYDKDGRLHVAITHISKANICPYRGREIPDYQGLKLDPDHIYQLLRDPDELAKAAPTFNNIPLLSEHVPVTAADHRPELVVGSTGTDAIFVAPHLDNSLVVWAKAGIDAVESEEKKELSCAYRYRADMTPGTYMGADYDGVMRDIVGNHVALVEEGRAGADVVVGDSKLETMEFTMTKTVLSRKAAMAAGALIVHLQPKLAQDAKFDPVPILKDVTAKNFKEKSPAILADIKKALDGKLAKDASLDDVTGLLDKLDKVEPGEDAEPMPIKAKDAEEFLKGKLSASDAEEYEKLKAKDAEETDEEKKKKDAADKAAKDAAEEEAAAKKKADDAEPKPVTEKAMDAAIKKAVDATAQSVRDTERGIQTALRRARPYVGELELAFDSAEQVDRHVLKVLGVKGHDTIHASALASIVEMQPLPGSVKKTVVAMDASAADAFGKRFPGTERIQLMH